MISTAEKLKQSPRMRLHFNVHEPVELVEMTLAFQGLGYEYQRHLKEHAQSNGGAKNSSDVKLYITRIESNCILAELAPALPLLGVLSPVINDVNSVADFIRNISDVINFLKAS